MRTLKIILSAVLFSIICIMQVILAFAGDNENKGLTYPSEANDGKINNFIQRQMKSGKIPGMYVAVVREDGLILNKGYGYVNLKTKEIITDDTLFEIGSLGEPFTALGIIKLRDEGKLNLTDRVSKFIQGVEFKRSNVKTEITIEQLLYKKVWIDPGSLASEKGELFSRLKGEIKVIQGVGSFQNHMSVPNGYDILAMIIQKASGMSYVDFINSNVLNPLGLKNMDLKSDKQNRSNANTGYKIGFLKPQEYLEGANQNGCHLTSSAGNLGKWLMNQFEDNNILSYYKTIIKETQGFKGEINSLDEGLVYTMGWNVRPSTGDISSTGNEPGFSSYMVFNPDKKLGVLVLGNMNSQLIKATGKGIIDIIGGTQPVNSSDYYQSIDKASLVVIVIDVLIILLVSYFLLTFFIQLYKKKRKFRGNGLKGLRNLILSLFFLSAIGFSLYKIPDVFFNNASWNIVKVWFPVSMTAAIVLSFVMVLLYYLYFISTYFFPVEDNRSYFSLISLSIFSGCGFSFLTFIINTALAADSEFRIGLIYYFFVGLILYVFSLRTVRSQLTVLTNNYIFEKRIEIIGKILETSYHKLESIGKEKIYACLNNDTEVVSGSISIIATGITSLIIIICCFIYLAISSFYSLLVSLGFISVVFTIILLMNKASNKYWEQSRDNQNIFFRYINDLLNGFKELYLQKIKRREFSYDVEKSCETYRIKRTNAELISANISFASEIMIFCFMAVLIFVLPLVYSKFEIDTLRNFIVIFILIKGHFDLVIGMVPRVTQVKVSWNRINEIINSVSSIESGKTGCDNRVDIGKGIKLELKDIQYSYKNEENENFSVGPINCEFRSGEITFITGGNGSGKSTLAKLITGLYDADNGEIILNGKRLDAEELGQYYSAVFSDYYLFEKLYGIQHENKKGEIEKYLNILKIDKKLRITNGVFSTTNLSTGQKKRMALLLTYLEDYPIYLFDEWAADQDPEFRKFFYLVLLPEMKRKNKCIVAITHDDRYFNVADKIIKMEGGQVVKDDSTNLRVSL